MLAVGVYGPTGPCIRMSISQTLIFEAPFNDERFVVEDSMVALLFI
jgi:hypothetical protein